MGQVVAGRAGMRGFDCNAALNDTSAKAMFNHGYRFAVRYVRRITTRPFDLSAAEVEVLHRNGLAVMPVQHVESERSWIPSDEKGRTYGQNAVNHARECGVAVGTSLWLDLEGVDEASPHESIIRYCNYWYDRVANAGYLAGIYVGWGARLSSTELYRRLKFARYWGAFNLNRDQEPAVRGLCMKQGIARPADKPHGLGFDIDTDEISADKLGAVPALFAPDEWSV